VAGHELSECLGVAPGSPGGQLAIIITKIGCGSLSPGFQGEWPSTALR
jgi:hypothetical protein